jgi:hypothetical protein
MGKCILFLFLVDFWIHGIYSKNKQKNTSQAKHFQNPIEKGQINIPANIYMTSYFPGLVQVLK